MTRADAPEFYKRLAALGELFDAKPFSDAKCDLYFDALSDIPLNAIVYAMNDAARTCKFMPRPAEIRERAIGNNEESAEIAWQWWKEQARRIGSYQTLVTDDAALAETLVAIFGGWPQACVLELSPEMWANKRKEFGRVYAALKQRQLTGPRRLLGIIEQDNTSRGYLGSAPTRAELGTGDDDISQ